MYLKKLESVGFKSFAERINVEFVPGVTAVVGPNGSGKSNLIDAIRWVLGEQSAKSLRGTKMEDIIFQGSDSRKPLNVAEVTLVLDNQSNKLPLDYGEVSVTRRVYRSGESEFYINKQPCRLKDIIDLFLDSGLGREAFSIISQGEVEEILSSKPEERRKVFEEAAGVLKYKQRKKQSEYKLAETQENLKRVEDIIYEINRQLTPLEKQAETARNYLQLKDKLTEKEIAYLLAEIEVLHSKWEAMNKEVQADEQEGIAQKTSIQTKEAWLEKQKHLNQQLDNQIQSLQEKLLKATASVEKAEAKIQIYTERSKNRVENEQKIMQQKEEASIELAALNTRLDRDKKEQATLKEQHDVTIAKVSVLEKEKAQSKEQLSEQIEDLNAEYIEHLNQQAAYRNELQLIERQLEQIRGNSGIQHERFQDTLTRRIAVEKEKQVSDEKLAGEQAIYTEKEAALHSLKATIEIERKTFQELQTKLYQGYQQIEKVKSRKEMLEEMKEDFQGFFYGVKAVLKARGESRLEHIHGAIIELITVPKEYVTAIETSLGGQAQHIVVSDEAAARSAIQWLKKTNNGRATFLPLSVIKARSIPAAILKQAENHPGFINTAANIVSTDKQYKHAVDHLIGHIIIAETLKDANEIAQLTGRKYRIVTRAGDVVNPGGAMSGGAAKKTNQSLFTRDQELVEIKEKLQSLERHASQFSEKVNAKKAATEEIASQIASDEQFLVEKQQLLREIQVENHAIHLQLSSLNDSLSIYDRDEKQAIDEEQELERRQSNLENNLQDLQAILTSTQEKINNLTEQEATYKEVQVKLQGDLQENKLLLAKQTERYASQNQRVNELEEQLETATQLFNSYETELQKLAAIKATEETEDEIIASLAREKASKESLLLTIQNKRAERSKRTMEVNDEELELKELNRLLQKLLASIQAKEIQVNRLDVDLDNQLKALENEYTITYEKAKRDYEKASDRKLAKTEVENLKQKMSALGPVNFGAIEEYDRIYKRQQFLTDQQTDLVEAKNTLYGIIDELDEEMKERFETTFSQIKQEFTIVFKELFGGGRAELILTDENDMLETGVDIIAEPPGKKLKHLGLLSGGERALTAISLLFAILRVRPVPFCILDEVEAALDEANVSRFAKYLKMYSEETQFIVITHRKGTMEEADVLYGVTMQESGVSRFVSVKLEDTEQLVQS